MYTPVKDGIEKTARSVRYVQSKPPDDLATFVDCFWELKTEVSLTEDFYLHVIPDACVNILFNLNDPDITAVTARQTTYVPLNLGRAFHYAGIQLLPGVWQGDRDEIVTGFVNAPYTGGLPLIETSHKLTRQAFSANLPALSELTRRLVAEKTITANDVTTRILAGIDDIRTVSDMAALTHLSPRQLQRILLRTTGFSPHDFLKVIRLQRSFHDRYPAPYTDQSHFIRSFRAITGYTPGEYFKRFDV